MLEVIVELPKFSWLLKDETYFGRSRRGKTNEPIETRLSELIFVEYEREKPRTGIDTYEPLDVSRGISLDDLSFIKNKKDDGRDIGLSSKVIVGEPFGEGEYKFAHIPMIDFDTHERFYFMREEKLLKLIKDKIVEEIELNRGVLLRSSSKRNYHFIGIGKLLPERDFITFLGLALTMGYVRDGTTLNFADSRHIGHALCPIKYMPDLEKQTDPERGKDWSRYEIEQRFSTLRVSPRVGEDYPKVIDVLDAEAS